MDTSEIPTVKQKEIGNNIHSLSLTLEKYDLNISNNPRGTDKGDFKCYVNCFYENEFASRQHSTNRLLEIGVRSGASLALWVNYFKDIEIIGLDIEEIGSPRGPVEAYINYPNINFIKQDAYEINVAKSISGKFTIMIDDGPHSLSSQIKFLNLYLDKLDEYGVLIIEDILFAYRDCYRLMKSLPGKNKYLFEVYNFEKIKEGGGFLFVVRHNLLNKSTWRLRVYVSFMALFELFQVLFRRIRRGDFSFKDRRVY